MHRFKIDDPDICLEFMQENFCMTEKENAIEHVNKLMKVRGGHSNQQPWQDGSLRSQN